MEREMTTTTPAVELRKIKARSRVTNGGEWLPGVDQRSAVARRYRDLCALIVGDQGGLDRISEARLQLIRRFAAAAVLAEQLEARLVSGEQIDLNEHALLCSSLVRLAQRIGINKALRDVMPKLADYDYIEQEQPDEAAVDD
jgi:hypothetical protein